MSEFIDAKELETYFKNIANEFGDAYKNIDLKELSEHDKKLLSTLADYLTRTIIAIEMFPRIDAEPVKHGRWIKKATSVWHCSVCLKENHYAYYYDLSDYTALQDYYCPNCGAKMDGEVNNE